MSPIFNKIYFCDRDTVVPFLCKDFLGSSH
nr:MAG TPA: hypothetical protein [Caudoviricetes sp.]